MNPVDHPHGGGEGKSKGGRHPVTPWGVPTLGKRTRRKHKASDKLIVRGRRRGKGKRSVHRASKAPSSNRGQRPAPTPRTPPGRTKRSGPDHAPPRATQKSSSTPS